MLDLLLTSMDRKRLLKIEHCLLPVSGRVIRASAHVDRILHHCSIESNVKVAN